jgi:hypothetical protein
MKTPIRQRSFTITPLIARSSDRNSKLARASTARFAIGYDRFKMDLAAALYTTCPPLTNAAGSPRPPFY